MTRLPQLLPLRASRVQRSLACQLARADGSRSRRLLVVSGLSAESRRERRCCVYRIGLREIGPLRLERVSCHASSKHAQTGEPAQFRDFRALPFYRLGIADRMHGHITHAQGGPWGERPVHVCSCPGPVEGHGSLYQCIDCRSRATAARSTASMSFPKHSATLRTPRPAPKPTDTSLQ